jgi:hypothetical protein
MSTPSVPLSSHHPLELAAFVAAILIPGHPSKGVAEAHKGAPDERGLRSRDLTSISIEAFPDIVRYVSNDNCRPKGATTWVNMQ